MDVSAIRDAVDVHAAITAIKHSPDFASAAALLSSMRVSNVVDAYAYCAAISACGKSGQVSEALGLLDAMESVDGIEPDRACFNAALAACARSGCAAESNVLLSQMTSRGLPPDATAYTTAGRAALQAGDLCGALAVMERLRSTRLQPQLSSLKVELLACQALLSNVAASSQAGEAAADVWPPSVLSRRVACLVREALHLLKERPKNRLGTGSSGSGRSARAGGGEVHPHGGSDGGEGGEVPTSSRGEAPVQDPSGCDAGGGVPTRGIEQLLGRGGIPDECEAPCRAPCSTRGTDRAEAPSQSSAVMDTLASSAVMGASPLTTWLWQSYCRTQLFGIRAALRSRPELCAADAGATAQLLAALDRSVVLGELRSLERAPLLAPLLATPLAALLATPLATRSPSPNEDRPIPVAQARCRASRTPPPSQATRNSTC